LLAARYGDLAKIAGMEFFLVRISFFQTLAVKTVSMSKAFEAVCRNCDRFASRPCSGCKGKKRVYEEAKGRESRNEAGTH